MTSFVDFFVAGVQKGGTTAIARYLSAHPAIQMSSTKEVHFFDKDRAGDWDEPDYGRLHRFFDWSVRNVVRGEATPIYTYWPPSLPRLQRYNPAAKLVIALRHPAYRAFSHWRMEAGRHADSLSFDEAVSAAGRQRVRRAPMGVHRVYSYIERSCYGEQIERALSLFPRGQVHFTRTDELWRRPDDVLRSLFAFLGVPPLNQGIRQEYIVPSQSADVGLLPKEMQAKLTRHFAADIRNTATLTGLDLTDWLDESYTDPMPFSSKPGGR